MADKALQIIKAVAPYVAQIATAAIPAFTSKSESGKIDPVVSTQIEELQAAATQNAESIHMLAEKLQQAIEGVEVAEKEVKKQVLVFKRLLQVSLVLSTLSIVFCVCLWFAVV